MLLTTNEHIELNKIQDEINHPNYYKNKNSRECIEEMIILFGKKAVINFCKLNAYKYKYRAGNKNGNSEEKDLAKANWYLDYAERLKDTIHLE